MLKSKIKKTEREKCLIRAENLLSTALSLLLFCGTYSTLKAQAIPQYFFGENAWMPDSVGNDDSFGGNLHANWPNVQQSNVKLVRVGGYNYDFARLSNYQYLKMVDSIRNKGMEPILQVPFGDGAFDTTHTSAIITYINITHGRNVKYWAIGNEPDLSYTANKSATKVTTYIKERAIIMKKIDPSILIVGPALSRLNRVDVNDPSQKLADKLSDWNGPDSTSIVKMIPSGNGSATGKAYVDFFDYHVYNYNGSGTTTRAWLINKLTSTKGDSTCMGWMKSRCNLVNSNITGRSTYPLKPMITEANICFQPFPPPSYDGWADLKASGFFAGQHWCEMMSLGIAKGIESIDFWSIMEGSGSGFMTNASPGVKKSTYYHMKEMGQWFTGTYYLGTDNQTNIKALGSMDGNHISVMVLNQDTITAASKPYTINLNNTSPATTTWITMAMSVSKSYTDTIDAASSTLLVFDLNGNISQKYYYKQSDGSSQPGFHQRFNVCGSNRTYASQAALDAYYPAVYNNLILGDASGANSVTVDGATPHFNNSIYHAVNSITLEKNFSSGAVGQTLQLIIDPTCQ